MANEAMKKKKKEQRRQAKKDLDDEKNDTASRPFRSNNIEEALIYNMA